MMKKFIILMIAIPVITIVAAAQGDDRNISILPVAFEKVGDSVSVKIDMNLNKIRVKSRKTVSLVPVISNNDVSIRLPAVEVKGNAAYLLYKRKMVMMTRKEKQSYQAPYTVVRGYKTNPLTDRVLYSVEGPYQSWMSNASLSLQEEVYGCSKAPKVSAITPLAQELAVIEPFVLEEYVVTPVFAYIVPQEEKEKKRMSVSEAYLDFQVGKSNIVVTYLNNPKELEKITNIIAKFRNDPDLSVKSITVEGYASPEGPLSFNDKLSRNRAQALVDYIQPLFNFPKDIYKVKFGGENWDGLKEMLNKSDINFKDDILGIINWTTSDEIKKREIKAVGGGEPYKYMLKNFYPYLRKAVCTIDYLVKPYSKEKARDIYNSNPQNLSLLEIYGVAMEFEPGSLERTKTMETAAILFPKDDNANLNAAQALMMAGDIATAEFYLDRVNNYNGEFFNALGVLYLLKGEYNSAEVYLKKAVENGSVAANDNLDELSKKRENIEMFKKMNQ